ncbi:hypothetical protein SAMN05216553_115111 [Lentzea fradiae]|uniref:MftR C-terminal domain-containing protein n=1 Tax=Lentzea fradiae TaxID=200378 RepID=A0A1G7ZCN6_9PSEU|nr:hypothetical protein [Lentzea fradiae]SDH06458.1 hypothetical protein SAMN05216553_115111 [Lentzea fradiae]
MATTSEHVDLRDDLVRLVTSRLLDPLEILLPQADLAGLHRSVEADAEMWAAQLLGGDDALARQTAVRLIAVLHPGDTPFDPPDEWWATPLGRVAARRIGHPGKEFVSFGVAGAMLGITRQGVHDLVTRKKLTRHPEGGVTVDSIRARLDLRRQR